MYKKMADFIDALKQHWLLLISYRAMVFIATFNTISVISWLSILLVEETQVPVASHWQILSHTMLYQVHLAWAGFGLTTLVVIGTECIGRYKVKPAHVVTSIKQSPVLKGHIFLVLS